MKNARKDDLERALARMTADLKQSRSGVNSGAVRRATQDFILAREGATGLPTPQEVSAYLDRLVDLHGQAAAYAAFSHLQIGAAWLWGAAETAFFAKALRQKRVGLKPARKTEWEKAAKSIERLPRTWQTPMFALSQRSRECGRRPTGLIWSASRIKAVADALCRWVQYCAAEQIDCEPTGARLDTYGKALLARGTIGRNSIADYLERIVAGYHDVLTQTPPGPGAAFVVADWKGMRGPAVTKSTRQLVGARALFDLGLRLMSEARARPTHGISAATTFRDGLLLAVGISLPQRSRALSALEFDHSLTLGPRPTILIDLDGHVMKMRQTMKKSTRKKLTIESPLLWDALDEYRNHFRRLFDDGGALFPSRNAPGQALSERRLSSISRERTKEHFGVRVSIHRLRDNVATESAEELPNGAAVGRTLLDHKNLLTTRWYDHSEGQRAMQKINLLLKQERDPLPKVRLR